LDVINEEMAALNPDKTYYIHCAGGYRSMIFASILKARGFDKLIDVQGGFKAIKDSGKFDLVISVSPSTLS
jgi:rhodanese-related sulfurtransferase